MFPAFNGTKVNCRYNKWKMISNADYWFAIFCNLYEREIMNIKHRIQIITVISLLLVAGMGGGLPGRSINAYAAESKTVSSEDAEISSPIEVTVPIYDYDILNVLVPTSYAVAFNPYGLNIRVGEDRFCNSQVISRNYGIVNESTRDKLVTVAITVEDLNQGQITFVDSAEAAREADAETFAIYLALVPADDGEIMVDNRNPDKDITAAALADVSMGQSAENAVALLAGENQITFKLSGALYGFLDDAGISLGDEGIQDGSFQLMELAADGTGVTAFTFDGVMNPNADWTKLQRGIKISVIYTYENATGTEMIVEGTGAMVEVVGE